jgi:hypothetical protein
MVYVLWAFDITDILVILCFYSYLKTLSHLRRLVYIKSNFGSLRNMNWEESERKWLWRILRYYSRIVLEVVINPATNYSECMVCGTRFEHGTYEI